MEKTIRNLKEVKLNDDAVFFKDIVNNEIINLGVRYYEDGLLFEENVFFSFPDLSSFKYRTIINPNTIAIIENNKIVCLYSIIQRRRIPTGIIKICNIDLNSHIKVKRK